MKMNLRDKNILVTAGPTIEKIDDVRFISNFSSGKMGYALAQAAEQEAANVFLVSGPVTIPNPNNVKIFKVESALEMYNKVHELKDKMDVFIMSAAVADYRPKNHHQGKLKKDKMGENPIIELEKNQKPNDLFSITERIIKTHVLRLFVYNYKFTYCIHCRQSWFGLLQKCPSCGGINSLVSLKSFNYP